jgi:hypothetical protein
MNSEFRQRRKTFMKSISHSPLRSMIVSTFLTISSCGMECEDEGIRIALCGDSTMANYITQEGYVGWGEVLHTYLSPNASIFNHAVPGANAELFVRERLSTAIKSRPNIAIIQFGHNFGDSIRELQSLDSIAKSFQLNGARVIFITPMVGRELHVLNPPLNSAIRQAALRLKSPIIQLDSLSSTQWRQVGIDSMPLFFRDFIHLSGMGASMISKIIASSLITLEPSLKP